MPLSTADQVRLRLTDPRRIADATYYGDGTASSFVLPHNNVISGSAYVTGSNGAWSATGATFNPTGQVVFTDVPAYQQSYRLVYQYSVFSDDDIGLFTAVGGDVVGATLQGIQVLIVDASKRARWMAPEGTQFDDTLATDALYKAYSALKDEQGQDAAAAISLQSWTINQGDY